MAKNDNGDVSIAAGFNTTASEYEANGRWTGGDKVRFYQGRAEKIGGWVKWNIDGTEVGAICRSAMAWFDFSYNTWLCCGTSARLWVFDNDKARYNITPYSSTGTLANPFSTTNASTSVTVAHTSHGVSVGDYVNFSGASAVGGITVSGEYTVTTVVDADSYTITHSVAASSTAGPGGGASVTYSYELPAGNVDFYSGGGWGLGTWGSGTWGTTRSSSTYLQYPRYWSLDKFGQYLIANPSGGGIYMWQNSSSSRAAVITNAPTECQFAFVTSERMIVAIGTAGDLMQIQWCDQNDVTIWAAAATNTANTRKLMGGSRLIAGARVGQQVNMIWSDTSAHLMQWTGDNNVYSTRIVATNCGIAGPGAFIVVNGQPFWMSEFAFYTYTGGVSAVPRSDEIADIFLSMTQTQKAKTTCHYNSKFNEVWWSYPSTNAAEPDSYIAVCLDDYSWFTGTIDRGAWTESHVNGITTLFGIDAIGAIYEHEYGTDADGEAIDWWIESGFFDIGSGDTSMNIDGYIPDFKRQTGAIDITFSSKDYPDDTATLDIVTKSIAETDSIADFRHFGRQVRFMLSQTGVIGGDFRLGADRIEATASGARR